MANRNDVVLTIKANDLGTPTLEKLKTLLGQVTSAQEALAKSSGNADEAIAELTKQQEALVEATKPLAGLQAIAQRLLGTGQEIAAKKAQVAGLREEIDKLAKEIDAAGGKGTAQQNSGLRRLESDAKRAQAQLDKLKQTASDLASKLDSAGLGRNAAGALRQINAVGSQALGAQANVPQQIAEVQRLRAAEVAAAEEIKRREAEITAEVQRRAEAEARIAAIREKENAQAIADAARISNRRLSAVSAFSTLPDDASIQALRRQEEITAEVKRRADIQAEADAREKKALDAQIADYVRLSNMRANATYAFSNMPSASEANARRESPLRVASAQESYELRRQKAVQDAAAAAKKASAEEASAAQQSASVFVQASDREIAAAAKKAAAMRASGATTAQILEQSKELGASASAYQKLGLAFDEMGNKAGKAAKGFSLFRDEGRTTLSLTQRIRGEILSLTAAYVGIYGVIDQFNKVIDTAKNEQAVKAQLSLVVGNDPAAVAKQYAFLRSEADRVGQSFETVSDGYAKVAVAAQKYGLTQAEVNKQFSDLLTVARAQGLSSVQLGQANLAIQQIFDYTKIRSQEFNQIIGSGINGLGQALAKAVPDAEGSVQKLRKIMETTGVPARALAIALDQVAKQSLPAFTQQMKGADAAQNTFENSLNDLRRAFADSGFIQAFTQALRDLTEKFKDPEFKESVKQLGSLLGDVLKAVVALATNTNVLRVAMEALGLIVAGKITGALIGITTALKAMGLSAGAAATSVTALQGAFGVFAAAVAGFEVGNLLNKLAPVQRAADILVTTLVGSADALAKIASGDFKGAKALIDSNRAQVIDDLKNFGTTFDAQSSKGGGKGDTLSTGSSAQPGAGASSLGLALTGGDDSILKGENEKLIAEEKVNAQTDLTNKLVELQNQLNEKKAESDKNYVAKYKAQFAELIQQATDFQKKYGDSTPLNTLNKYINQLAAIDASKDAKSAGKKSEELLKELGSSLSKVVEEVKAGQKEIILTSTAEIDAYLDRQRQAIEQKYALLIAKINKVKPGQTIDIGNGQQLTKQQALDEVAAARAIEEATARTAAYQKAITDQKEQTTRLDQAQAAEIAAVNAKVETGLESEYDGKVEILKIQDKYRASILDSVEKTKQLLVALRDGTDADKDLFKKLGGDALLAQLDAIQTKTSQVETIWTEAFKKFKTDLAGGATDSLITFGKGLAGVITGANSLGQAFQGALKSFREFAANFLEQIAQMILQTIILKAIQNSSFGGSFGLLGGGSGGYLHSGGMVSAPTTSKPVMSSWFVGAPRYHTGGIVGLKPNEVPIIAKRGEEVLSEGDPRNALNGGRGGMGPAAAPNVKIINTIDSESFVSQGLATEGGVRALLNVMRAHQNTVKNTLGIR